MLKERLPTQTAYSLCIAAVISLGLLLRFWQLNRFNALVFDEVYYVRFAQAYLEKMPVFDAHPPVGKYLIATGIWLNAHNPFSLWTAEKTINSQIGLSTVSYRWMNALVGGLIPLVVIGIVRTLSRCSSGVMSFHKGSRQPAYKNQLYESQLDKNQTLALLAGLFVAVDGLFVAESRYALLNVYVVFFGLLAHWLWFYSRKWSSSQASIQVSLRVFLFRALAGVAIGLAVGTKWNGLGYWLSLVLWEGVRAYRLRADRYKHGQYKHSQFKHRRPLFPWRTVGGAIVYGFVIPALTYGLCWWPHLALTGEHLVSIQTQLFSFHYQLGAVGQAACSKWYTWPLLIKPFPYWYEEVGVIVEGQTRASAYTVSNLGNPILWWLSSAAMLLLLIEACRRLLSSRRLCLRLFYSADAPIGVKQLGVKQLGDKQPSKASFVRTNDWLKQSPGQMSLNDYLLIGYLANWLPWAMVSRCTYLYLYMPAAVFAFMAFASVLSGWLYSPFWRVRFVGWGMLGAIALAVYFWLPLAIGEPLSPDALQMRWWLRSWI